MAPYRAGTALDRTSGYEKFEAFDPAEWAERGYAVLNIDARGTGHSEGVITRWGVQEAGTFTTYGRELMVGYIADQLCSRMHHPALKAIAPWECYTDLYRRYVARGGHPHIPGFHRMISNGLAGPEGVENVVAMLEKHSLYDDYWEAKRIPVEKIENIPILSEKPRQTRSGFVSIRIKSYVAKDTNWEFSTPRVRLSLLGFESDESSATTVIERPKESYPLARQRLRTLYLDGTNGKLMDLKPDQECIKPYEGRSLGDGLTFTTTFDVVTELAGYPKAVLHMSCPDHDDFDVIVQIRKIDNKGRQLSHLNYPCPVPIDEVPDVYTAKTLGPQGFLRASHHVSLNGECGPVGSDDLSRETDILYSHRVRQPISPEPEDENVGRHFVHTGGKYDSHLVIPVIMG
ncbi:Cocaine esterase [Fusarium agapanthi]|uniref:Cocaine esterase n=1 Tax=Fusarium agapanthi TaxID=1803897 RepID=A0A9P5AWZ5_9HYPO|nr:Cocaine esterase [Fusarium agapanthi]